MESHPYEIVFDSDGVKFYFTLEYRVTSCSVELLFFFKNKDVTLTHRVGWLDFFPVYETKNGISKCVIDPGDVRFLAVVKKYVRKNYVRLFREQIEGRRIPTKIQQVFALVEKGEKPCNSI